MTRSALILAIAFGLAGCDPAQLPWGAQPETDAGPALPPADVQLPPVPNLDLADVPTTYDDGSYSVSGILLNREDLRDSALRVTGILQEVYVCSVPADAPEEGATDDEASRNEVRPGCLRPHLYIADTLRSGQRLLVTGYDAALYEPQVSVGTKYVFSGVYSQQARGFISTEDGLVIAREISGEGIVLPEPEPTEGDTP